MDSYPQRILKEFLSQSPIPSPQSRNPLKFPEIYKKTMRSEADFTFWAIVPDGQFEPK
ncbi:MAG: hypothetical protein V7K67_29540 [Nostoc sp.]|uniref:hypothetical protein n=1 Tax=Nostoc sp. TaxID=1180 RepID=UPI002FFB07A1